MKKRLAEFESYAENSIVNSIEFDENTYQAGVSILSYFSTIVRQKYPESDFKIRIEQEGRTVRLVIVTPMGEREEIEKSLEEFGMVVVGQMQPEQLLTDPIHVMQLRHKLELAAIELAHTKDLLGYAKEAHSREIATLHEEVAHLKMLINDAFKRENTTKHILTRMVEAYTLDGEGTHAVIKLAAHLEQGLTERDKYIILELLAIIKRQNTSAFNDIKTYIISSLGGASGNLLSSWIPALFAALPK